jgi:hypothetical protein
VNGAATRFETTSRFEKTSQSDSKSAVAQTSAFSENRCADPVPRVVLLGASNLSQGISTVVETAQNICRQPVQVLAAAGFGRSYGIDSRVLGRTLPGIIHCGLWETLAQQTEIPTTALVTDIGNDILYGVEVPQILEWVKTVIDRLQQAQARICLTLLPPIEPSNLSSVRFHLFRTLFFPNCRLQRDHVLQRADELHAGLHQLGTSRGVHVMQQHRIWYGWDPIHIHRRQWRHAWREILSAWRHEAATPTPLAQGSLSRWLYLQTRRPHRRTFWGREQRRQQPAAQLRNGTTVSFY